MSTNATIEERLGQLEVTVAKLQKQVESRPQPENWWDRIAGIMADVPEFDEVVEIGRQIRAGKMEVPGLEP